MSVRRTRDTTQRVHYAPPDWERLNFERLRDDDERSPFEIDRSRIIHSAAFRRLQGKTQIFGVVHDNFYRTRLTHSLEVAQIAKGIALVCGANTELVEAISLAHDIGHPPFGHAGERALDACLKQYTNGMSRFESNAQNLRTLAHIETKQPSYPGLNLTRSTLDGLLKHKREGDEVAVPICYDDEEALMRWVTAGAPFGELSLEAQIVDWADQVAYSVHDLEDGIHAGMITSARLCDPRISSNIIAVVSERFTHSSAEQTYNWLMAQVRMMEETSDARIRAASRKQLTSSLIHRFVTAAKPRRRKREADPLVTSERYAHMLFIPEAQRGRAAVFNEIARQLILHDQGVATLEHRSAHVVSRLFTELVKEDTIDLYPEEFRDAFAAATTNGQRARVTCDFIAAMTDSYAEMFFQRLFSPGSSASNTFDRF